MLNFELARHHFFNVAFFKVEDEYVYEQRIFT